MFFLNKQLAKESTYHLKSILLPLLDAKSSIMRSISNNYKKFNPKSINRKTIESEIQICNICVLWGCDLWVAEAWQWRGCAGRGGRRWTDRSVGWVGAAAGFCLNVFSLRDIFLYHIYVYKIYLFITHYLS
jgi:hypothetical protein